MNLFFFDLLKPNKSRVEELKSQFSQDSAEVWDPLGRTLSISKLVEDNAKLLSQYEELKADPRKIKRQKRIGVIIATIGSFFATPLFF